MRGVLSFTTTRHSIAHRTSSLSLASAVRARAVPNLVTRTFANDPYVPHVIAVPFIACTTALC